MLIPGNRVKFDEIKYLWILAFIAGLILDTRTLVDQQNSPVQITVIHRIVAIIILAHIMLYYVKLCRNAFRGVFGVFGIFALYQISSSAWSVNSIWTLYRGVEYFLILLLVDYTVTCIVEFNEADKWGKMIICWYRAILVVVLFGILLFPDKALIPSKGGMIPLMLQGVWPRVNANSLSHFSGAVGVISLCRIYNKKNTLVNVVILFICIGIMFMSQGRSGILSFLVASFVCTLLYKKKKILIVYILLIVTFLLLSDFFETFMYFLRRGQSDQVLIGLSGRVEKWEAILDFYKERPFFGYGAYAGSRFLAMIKVEGTIAASSAHNAIMELLVDTGGVGVSIFISGLIYIWYNLLRAVRLFSGEKKDLAIQVFSIYCLVLVRSVFTILLMVHNDFLFFWVLGMSEYYRRLAIRKGNQSQPNELNTNNYLLSDKIKYA